MTVFVDTSALYALLVRTEVVHPSATGIFQELVTREVRLVTTNYVLLESTALLQRRIGLTAVRDLHQVLVPWLGVRWVTEPVHDRAMHRLVQMDRRRVSLVDCTSFVVMESEGLSDAFAFDDDFVEAGFHLWAAS